METNIGNEFHQENEEGQSTVEFLFTFIMAVGIIFLFIQLAINMSSGYMAHYATYMASRTYMVMDNGSDDPEGAYSYAADEATKVFRSYRLKRFLIESNDFGINKHSDFPHRREKLYVGAYFQFKQKLSIFSMIGGNVEANLVSESFLGREPSRHQCKKRICEIMKNKLGYPNVNCIAASGHNKHVTYFDNGC